MTPTCQGPKAVFDVEISVLPQVVESYDVTAHARLYSGDVAKKTGHSERKGGRELWDGGRIREIREERSLSREQLAELADANADDVGRHERNDKASNPSVDTLVRIAVALQVHPGVLFEPVGSSIPRPRSEAGRDEDRALKGSAVLEGLLAALDAEAPAEDSWRGDVLKALAALNRALRRSDTKSGVA